MKTFLKFIILLLIISGFSEKEETVNETAKQFTTELLALQEYFQIPGMAVSIDKNGENIYENYLGVADVANNTQVDSSHLFPIASITKVFSGVLIMKLLEQEKLSLDDPINMYLSKSKLSDSILVKHVLSHTSQGSIGKEFYYSSRFGLLTKVIEKATGNSFAAVLSEEILDPLQLKNTFLLKDSTQIARLAKPYLLGDGIENGFIDYGYSTSAGLVSNLKDLSIFNKALDENTLISEASKNAMYKGIEHDLPYGYGIFKQQFNGLDIVWAYGQYDCYSSLLLKIPADNITLTILANNNLLSDPARLIYGNLSNSLFAMSFLKNYVFGLNELALMEDLDLGLDSTEEREFYRDKLLAQALSASFMARFDNEKLQASASLLEKVFADYPDILAYADLSLLHNLAFLKDVAFYKDLGPFNNFDNQIEKIGKTLLVKEPNNPYAHFYLGNFYSRKKMGEKARYHFESILNADNFEPNWYTQEAENWLEEHN